jgi:hypothetical protein
MVSCLPLAAGVCKIQYPALLIGRKMDATKKQPRFGARFAPEVDMRVPREGQAPKGSLFYLSVQGPVCAAIGGFAAANGLDSKDESEIAVVHECISQLVRLNIRTLSGSSDSI